MLPSHPKKCLLEEPGTWAKGSLSERTRLRGGRKKGKRGRSKRGAMSRERLSHREEKGVPSGIPTVRLSKSSSLQSYHRRDCSRRGRAEICLPPTRVVRREEGGSLPRRQRRSRARRGGKKKLEEGTGLVLQRVNKNGKERGAFTERKKGGGKGQVDDEGELATSFSRRGVFFLSKIHQGNKGR